MEDIGLVKQGWKWLQSQKHAYSRARTALGCFKERSCVFVERHWPMVCTGCSKFGNFLWFILVQWRNSFTRGFQSMIKLGSSSLLVIMWSCFLSLTSMSCLLYVLLSMVRLFNSLIFFIGFWLWLNFNCWSLVLDIIKFYFILICEGYGLVE